MDETEAADRCYLLFAGSVGPPRGGLGDLVRTFTCGETARQAFHELRVHGKSHGTWAQLAVVDGDKGLRPLCWFGVGASPGGGRLGGTGIGRAAPASRARHRRRTWAVRRSQAR